MSSAWTSTFDFEGKRRLLAILPTSSVENVRQPVSYITSLFLTNKPSLTFLQELSHASFQLISQLWIVAAAPLIWNVWMNPVEMGVCDQCMFAALESLLFDIYCKVQSQEIRSILNLVLMWWNLFKGSTDLISAHNVEVKGSRQPSNPRWASLDHTACECINEKIIFMILCPFCFILHNCLLYLP